MRIPSKRKAISPVLATVILIAITLIAAVAIATFVFGIFGSSASPATYSIQTSSVQCAAAATASGPLKSGTYPAGLTFPACYMLVQNSGSAGGSITGAGPSNDFAVFPAASVTVPAGSSAGVYLHLTEGAGSASTGQTVTGFLVPGGSAANIPFTVVAP